MLSFLREQNRGESSKSKQNAGASSGDGAVKMQDKDYLTVAAQEKKVRNNTIMLAVLFIIGLLGLWFMIRKSSPQSASAAVVEAEEVQIETAIARITGVKSEMFSGMDEIVKKFYEFSDVLQVKVNELAKNPFILEMFMAGANIVPEEKEQTVEIDPEEVWRQQIKMKADKLELQSIMLSQPSVQDVRSINRYCCMIDNEILYEGDLIGGFRILQIGNDFVKLEWNEESDAGYSKIPVVLKLSE
jgi:Tfp pilus assembly protein PilN